MSEELLRKLEEIKSIFAEMSRDTADDKNMFWLGIWTGLTAAVNAVRKEAIRSNEK